MKIYIMLPFINGMYNSKCPDVNTSAELTDDYAHQFKGERFLYRKLQGGFQKAANYNPRNKYWIYTIISTKTLKLHTEEEWDGWRFI